MKMKELIRFDWAMKKLLRSKTNFGILEGFLSELLKDDIKILSILESEGNKEEAKDKYNRVDIKVENKKKEIIIIELQNDYEYDYLLRMSYGISKVITEHIQEGDPYGQVKKVISINIVYFDLGQGEDYVYHGTNQFYGIHKNDKLELSEKMQKELQKNQIYELFPEYYILKVNRFDDLAKDNLDEWIYFFKNSEIKKEFNAKGLKEAAQKLKVIELPENQRKTYERYLEELSYQASMEKSIKLNAEWKIREEGREEGERLRLIQIILNGIKNNIELETISLITGLSTQEIDKIIKENKEN